MTFAQQFLHFARHKTFSTVLADFLEIVLCTLAMGAQEERYLEIVGRYADTEVRETIPALFGALVNDYEKHIGVTPGAWYDLIC